MDIVTVTDDYKISLPVEVCQKMKIHPGQLLEVQLVENGLLVLQINPIIKARGSLKGIDTSVLRDNEDRI